MDAQSRWRCSVQMDAESNWMVSPDVRMLIPNGCSFQTDGQSRLKVSPYGRGNREDEKGESNEEEEVL